MASTTSPIQAAFELQRRSTEHGERLFEHGLEMHRDATETMLRNGFAAQQDVEHQAVEGVERTEEVARTAQERTEEWLDAARSWS